MIALLGAGLPAIGHAQQAAQEGAGRALESIDVHPLSGRRVELQLHLNAAAPKPMSFTIDNPARIALDLPGTS
ncbi:MAG TPA: hypothetical protein VFY39_12855, partial [Gammaproteobacteria bacterium]|nr:hypothetical protein [Gammaproteobacteria bacterium]